MDISEKNLEQTIEAVLLAGGSDAYPGGAGVAAEFPQTGEVRPFNIQFGRASAAVLGSCLNRQFKLSRPNFHLFVIPKVR